MLLASNEISQVTSVALRSIPIHRNKGEKKTKLRKERGKKVCRKFVSRRVTLRLISSSAKEPDKVIYFVEIYSSNNTTFVVGFVYNIN